MCLNVCLLAFVHPRHPVMESVNDLGSALAGTRGSGVQLPVMLAPRCLRS